MWVEADLDLASASCDSPISDASGAPVSFGSEARPVKMGRQRWEEFEALSTSGGSFSSSNASFTPEVGAEPPSNCKPSLSDGEETPDITQRAGNPFQIAAEKRRAFMRMVSPHQSNKPEEKIEKFAAPSGSGRSEERSLQRTFVAMPPASGHVDFSERPLRF